MLSIQRYSISKGFWNKRKKHMKRNKVCVNMNIFSILFLKFVYVVHILF